MWIWLDIITDNSDDGDNDDNDDDDDATLDDDDDDGDDDDNDGGGDEVTEENGEDESIEAALSGLFAFGSRISILNHSPEPTYVNKIWNRLTMVQPGPYRLRWPFVYWISTVKVTPFPFDAKLEHRNINKWQMKVISIVVAIWRLMAELKDPDVKQEIMMKEWAYPDQDKESQYNAWSCF